MTKLQPSRELHDCVELFIATLTAAPNITSILMFSFAEHSKNPTAPIRNANSSPSNFSTSRDNLGESHVGCRSHFVPIKIFSE